MYNKIIVKFYSDWGRMGNLEGVFVTTKEALESLYYKWVDFGDCLGKHSDVTEQMQEGLFEIIEADEDKVKWFESNIGCVGHNPFNNEICEGY